MIKVYFDFVDIAHARQLMQASLLSLKRNFDFVEDTLVNYVFLSRDSAIQTRLMAFAAPSVRQNKKKTLFFCSVLAYLYL